MSINPDAYSRLGEIAWLHAPPATEPGTEDQVGRYRLKVADISALLDKHPNSVTKWLNKGLRLERENPEFTELLDHLDAAISRQS